MSFQDALQTNYITFPSLKTNVKVLKVEPSTSHCMDALQKPPWKGHPLGNLVLIMSSHPFSSSLLFLSLPSFVFLIVVFFFLMHSLIPYFLPYQFRVLFLYLFMYLFIISIYYHVFLFLYINLCLYNSSVSFLPLN